MWYQCKILVFHEMKPGSSRFATFLASKPCYEAEGSIETEMSAVAGPALVKQLSTYLQQIQVWDLCDSEGFLI